MRSILSPDRHVAPQYQPWQIKTKDGQTRVGLPLRKSTVEIYRDATGNTFRIAGENIRSKKELNTSLMPPGLLSTLTRQEIRDLLAYLMTTPDDDL